jgi:hypothetical protein
MDFKTLGQIEFPGSTVEQEYPPRGLTGYETLVEGHGVFCAYASSEVATGSYHSYQVFNKIQAAPWSDSTWNTHNPSYSTSTGLPTRGAELGGHDGEWLKLQLPYRIKVNSYQIQIYGPYYDYAPDSWVIIGSNDNNNWETIDSISASGFTNSGTVVTKNYTVNNTNYYKYLALVCTKLDPQYSRAELNFSELRFFGTPGPTTLDKGSLTLGRSLDVPRVSRYDVDTETPRPEKLLVDFDTTVNSSPTDISGKGNHGTLVGATYSPADKAFTFNGTDQYIKFDTGLTGNAIFSVSMWFISTGAGVDTLFQINGDYTATSGELAWLYKSGNELFFDFHNNNLKVDYSLFNNNGWNHVVVTFDGNATTGRCIYANGVKLTGTLDGSSSGTALSLTNNTQAIIGAFHRTSQNDYIHEIVGKISNFKLYDVALEPSEVQKLYRLGRTGRSMVISDTAVGIGKVPDAQLDVRGTISFTEDSFEIYKEQGASWAASAGFPNQATNPYGEAQWIWRTDGQSGGTDFKYIVPRNGILMVNVTMIHRITQFRTNSSNHATYWCLRKSTDDGSSWGTSLTAELIGHRWVSGSDQEWHPVCISYTGRVNRGDQIALFVQTNYNQVGSTLYGAMNVEGCRMNGILI